MRQLTEAQMKRLNQIAATAIRKEKLSTKISKRADKTYHFLGKIIAAPVSLVLGIPRILDPKKKFRSGVSEGVQLGLKPYIKVETYLEEEEKAESEWTAAVLEEKFLDYDYESVTKLVAALRKAGVTSKEIDEVKEMYGTDESEPGVEAAPIPSEEKSRDKALVEVPAFSS